MALHFALLCLAASVSTQVAGSEIHSSVSRQQARENYPFGQSYEAPEYEIVVARYRENQTTLAWLAEVPSFYQITIINKVSFCITLLGPGNIGLKVFACIITLESRDIRKALPQFLLGLAGRVGASNARTSTRENLCNSECNESRQRRGHLRRSLSQVGILNCLLLTEPDAWRHCRLKEACCNPNCKDVHWCFVSSLQDHKIARNDFDSSFWFLILLDRFWVP